MFFFNRSKGFIQEKRDKIQRQNKTKQKNNKFKKSSLIFRQCFTLYCGTNAMFLGFLVQ